MHPRITRIEVTEDAPPFTSGCTTYASFGQARMPSRQGRFSSRSAARSCRADLEKAGRGPETSQETKIHLRASRLSQSG
jgi:hypothetical protein